ncbi:MAG TPA: anti-sigma factor [Pseudolabrys sp.]|jgi:anti-sigma factor RsiW|nr:anti-sigma factor [Pseudolabrys sp.]
MTKDNLPVTEDELHAYVDGELPADRQDAVAMWLATHEDAAAQVAAWRAQGEAIRARYGATSDEPVPERLKLERVMQKDRPWRSIAAAAACAAFLLGGATGWFAHGATSARTNGFEQLTADALEAHRLYTIEVRHPVEVTGDERPHMTQWLTKRLGYEQRIPDLSAIGLKLVGGRLLPGPDGAAAFYMYESASGERFTIYCSKSKVPETALRYKDSDRTAAFFWVDDNRAYVVSGPADRDRMETVTKAIYDQVERSETRKS